MTQQPNMPPPQTTDPNPTSAAIAIAPQHAAGAGALMSPSDVKAQMDVIHAIMNSVMRESVHYGTIPGTKKPTLYQPGAQVLGVAFGLVPRYSVTREDLTNGHREYEVTCELYTRDGAYVGMGLGNATTLEPRYRYRNAQLTCPECGGEGTIIKGKKQYGGGWVCFQRKGGCGAKFADNAPEIVGQHPGRVENPDPAEYYNTIKKIAAKRAFVHAIIQGTGCSDTFTQDAEDFDTPPPGYDDEAPRPRRQAPRRRSERNVTSPLAQQQAQQRNPLLVNPAQIGKIMAVAKENNVTLDELRDYCEKNLRGVDGQPVTSRQDILAADMDSLLDWMTGGSNPQPPQAQEDI